MRSRKNRLTKAGLLFVMAGMLSSCDYSDFSLFGFFYHRYIDNLENSYKKPGTNTGNSNSGNNSNAGSSSTEPVVKDFAPQAYSMSREETIDKGKLEIYQQFTLVSEERYALTYYSRLVTGDTAKTYEYYSGVGTYERSGNTVTINYEANVFADEKEKTSFSVGTTEEIRKKNVESAFKSTLNTIALNKDGSFAFGTQSDDSTLFTGLSTANTYYAELDNPRPSYNVITLIDDTNYFLSSFSKDSKDPETPVSALIGLGTYKTYDIKDESIHGQYETVRFDKGHGYMFAMNGTSPMKFDLNEADGISTWYTQTFNGTRSMRVTKEGYYYSVESGLEKYDVTIGKHSYEVLKTDVDSDPETPVEKQKFFSLKGLKNEAFTLDIYKDGTYKFCFTTYNAEEEGSWKYDEATNSLILTAKKDDKEKINTFVKDAESGNYKVNYVSLKSEQMSQEFVIDSQSWSDAFGSKSLGKFLGSVNSNIALEIFDNGNYVFSYIDASKNINFSEKGAWSYDAKKDEVVLTLDDKTNTISKKEDGSYVCDYVAKANAGLTQTFVLTGEQFKKTFPVVLDTLKGEKSDKFTFAIFSNSTFAFAYEIQNGDNIFTGKEEGSYVYDETKDSVTFTTHNKENVMALSSDGLSYKLEYVSYKNAALSQTFTMDRISFGKVFKKDILTLSGQKSQDTKMHFYSDNTYTFAFSANGFQVNESGTYVYDKENDRLALTCQDKVNYTTLNEDGSYTLEYISKRSAQMNQTFILTLSDMKSSFAVEALKMNGASGKPIDIYVYSNHSYLFSFAANGFTVTEEGSWDYDSTNDRVLFRHNKTVNYLKKNGGNYTMDYVSDRSSSLTQSYSITEAEFRKAFPTQLVELSGKKNASIKFYFYSNGTYCFYWNNPQRLIQEYGVYQYDASTSTLNLFCKNTKNTLVKNEDGSYTLTYQTNLNAGLNQEFSLTKEEFESIIA